MTPLDRIAAWWLRHRGYQLKSMCSSCYLLTQSDWCSNCEATRHGIKIERTARDE